MSTYQGEQFVVEQMQSILQQLPPEGRVLVRDDGSTDSTVQRIESIGDPRVTITKGENIGFVRSFFWLLDAAPDDAEVVMLADQDDVWLPEKIERACRHLRSLARTPALYCSRLQMVDAQLKHLGLSQPCPRGPSFPNALAENIVTGCTLALNPDALALVRSHGELSRIHFHDWWIYLVISAFGKVVFDDVPTMLYRQHGRNVVGRGTGIGRYVVNFRFILQQSWVQLMFNQIEHFRHMYDGALSAAQRSLVDANFNPRSRRAILRLLLVPARYRQFLADEFLLRTMIFLEILLGRGLLPANGYVSEGRSVAGKNGQCP